MLENFFLIENVHWNEDCSSFRRSHPHGDSDGIQSRLPNPCGDRAAYLKFNKFYT